MLNRRTFLSFLSLHRYHARYQESVKSRRAIWYCPSIFNENRELKTELLASLAQPETKNFFADNIDVFKLYIEAINEDIKHLNINQLCQLIDILTECKMLLAVEVGGNRLRNWDSVEGSGASYARIECQKLELIERAGGNISFITLDNPVMNAVSRVFRDVQKIPNHSDINILIRQSVESMKVFQGRFPNARIGVTESLGFFSFTGENQRIRNNLDPTKLPDLHFYDFMKDLIREAIERDVVINHFHIDFKYEGVLHDGNHRTLSFERVVKSIDILRKCGIETGIMIGAFDDYTLRKEKVENLDAANKSAVNNTIAYTNEFLKSRADVDHILLDRWEYYPNKMGSIFDDLSEIGLTYHLVKIIKREYR